MDRSKVAWQPKITCGKLRLHFDNLAQPSGSNSMVECQLPKLKVAGSIPVSRSSNHKYKAAAQTSMLTLRLFDFVTREQRENTEKTEITEQTENKPETFRLFRNFRLFRIPLFSSVQSRCPEGGTMNATVPSTQGT